MCVCCTVYVMIYKQTKMEVLCFDLHLIIIKELCSELLFIIIIKSSEFLCSPGAAKAYSHVTSLFVYFDFVLLTISELKFLFMVHVFCKNWPEIFTITRAKISFSAPLVFALF